MAWVDPRTWVGGERAISSATLNQHIADNQQFLFDTYTNVRGVYRDVGAYAIPSASSWSEATALTLNSRHEAILLTIVGLFPAGCRVQYRIDTNPDLEILNLSQARSVAKQWIIPSLMVGEHTVHIFMRGTGTVNSLQVDIRELT